MNRYDCLVVGTGGVGSAALYHLARRGKRALGLDRFPPGHDRGSSHGQTRIIRLAYHEHPDYVPLLRRAYELWSELEERRGEKLFHRTGLLQAGPPDGQVIQGVLASAREHDLEVEELSANAAEKRFPGVRLPASMTAVFEPTGGFLEVEECVRAHAEEALRLGAEIRVGEAVESWRTDGESVTVTTDQGTYTAPGLILTPGAWAGGLLADLGLPLEVRRKPLFWYRPETDEYDMSRGFPVFLYEVPEGLFYGFPQIDAGGFKVAEHTGGHVVADPLEVPREVDADEEKRVTDFVSAYFPRVSRTRTRHAVCMYTLTPDEFFVVDTHPQHRQVAFAAGLSGHGFKFTSVLGEVLAQMVLDGESEIPVGFLGHGRKGLRGTPG